MIIRIEIFCRVWVNKLRFVRPGVSASKDVTLAKSNPISPGYE